MEKLDDLVVSIHVYCVLWKKMAGFQSLKVAYFDYLPPVIFSGWLKPLNLENETVLPNR